MDHPEIHKPRRRNISTAMTLVTACAALLLTAFTAGLAVHHKMQLQADEDQHLRDIIGELLARVGFNNKQALNAQ